MPRDRVRSRSMVGNWTSSGTSIYGGGWDYKGNYNSVVQQSRIVDETHNKGGNNFLYHEKSTYTDASIVLPFSWNRFMSAQATASYNGYVFARGDNAPGPVLPVVDYTSAVNALIADAIGVMPTQVNLVVNAVEFAQLKTLVPGLLQGIGSLFTWGTRKKLGRKSARDIAGSHLAYSFGLMPLIRDFRSLFTIRSRVKERMRQLRDRNGKAVRLSKASSLTLSSSTYAARYGWSDDTQFTENGDWQVQSQGFVSARVTGFFADDPEAHAKAWASALGLSTPLQTLWELIPFSFVVDWFVPVGKAFQAAEAKLGLGATVQGCDISDWTTSIRRTCVRTGIISCKSLNYPGWNLGNCGSCGKTFYSYTRTPGIPETSFISAPSGWTMNKTALSISLIAQRVIR